ncbi:MAG: XRE family transcriptional regulator [Chitinophagaceae bacterium]|nr:MAG: XRE family transcriptional regulator [Chitinophagaceae bacterium]
MKKRIKRVYYRDDAFLQKIGERVRELRVAQGMTQMDLAFKCNDKDYSQINRVELGKVNFSVSYLALISDALGVTARDLLPK